MAQGKASCQRMGWSCSQCGVSAAIWSRQFPDPHHDLYFDCIDRITKTYRTRKGKIRMMTLPQEIITIAMCVAGTMLTRFLPFLVFRSKRPTPRYVQYLGKVLPGAIFAMLIIYCLRNISLLQGSHGLPELIAIAVTVGLHLWQRQMLLSIAGGTICYMLLVQLVF